MNFTKLTNFKVRFLLSAIFYLIAAVVLVRIINLVGVFFGGLDFLSWWPLGNSILFGIGGLPEPILSTMVSGLAIDISVPGLDNYFKTHWLAREGLSIITIALFWTVLAIFRNMSATVNVQKPFDFRNVRRVQYIMVLILIEMFALDYWRTESMKPVKALVNQMSGPMISTDSSYQNSDAYAYILVLFLLTLITVFRRGVILHQQQRDMEKRLYQKQKLEAVGTLASGVAHDFNNILTSIIGYAELAKSAGGQQDVNFALDRVLEASARAKRLTQQIRAIGSQTGDSVQEELVDLKDEVNELLLALAPSIPENIEIIKKYDQQLGFEIHADPTKIYQVLLNLCTNSLQAIGQAAGTLTIDVYQQANNGRAGYCFSIQDSGCGMSKEQLEQIFEPYFTTRKQKGGTGLGLSLCYSIIESYSGFIDVASTLNKGSCITVWLPEANRVEQSVREVSQQKVVTNILLVDNDIAIIALLKRKLSGLGHKVNGYQNCSAALDAFYKEPEKFDLVITDFNMPQMTGVKLAERVREKNADTPVIVITATPEQVNLGRDCASIKQVISKPIAMSELQNAILGISDEKVS